MNFYVTVPVPVSSVEVTDNSVICSGWWYFSETEDNIGRLFE